MSKHLSIKIHKSSYDAPSYTDGRYTPISLKTAHIVEKGTVKGLPTVDLLFTDEDGKKYVALVTGRLLVSLGATIEGVIKRTDADD